MKVGMNATKEKSLKSIRIEAMCIWRSQMLHRETLNNSCGERRSGEMINSIKQNDGDGMLF